MANRFSQGRDRSRQPDYAGNYRDPRQSEQFEQRGDNQFGEQPGNYRDFDERQEGGYRGGGSSFQPEGGGSSWRDRETRRGASYDPLGEYDRAGYSAGERAAQRDATHSTFRGDDFGAGQMAGPRSGYGGNEYAGNFFSQGTPDYIDARHGDRSGQSSRDQRGFFDRAGDEIASWFGDEDAERRREMDHRGRGPSNYTRSDGRLLEDACDRLTEDRYVDASNVTVKVEDGEVTLDGTVGNRMQKRRAEDCVHEVSGIGHVQNNLRIEQTDRVAQTDANTGTRA